MMIGIIGAMDVEIKELLSKMENTAEEKQGLLEFYIGKINGCECVVVKCGVGKVSAAVCAQTLILRYNPDAVINIGVAGGIGEGIQIGDLVISKSVVQHDMNTSALGDEIGLISGINKVYIDADEALSDLIYEYAKDIYSSNVFKGVIATGDIFVSENKMMKNIAEKFNASACEMEGGSVGQTCYMNDVPFVIIRSISDNGNDDASVDFMQFAESSANKYGELIFSILPHIKNNWRK